jgi:hypothetical protein
MDEPAPRDRRIGDRVSIEPIQVTWLTTDVVASGVLRRARPRPAEHPGRIVNVSVTGAGIEGPRHPDLKPRTRATLGFEGGSSQVLIRRVQPTRRPDVVYYGVQLEDLDPALREAIYSRVGEGRPGEQSWRRAW